MHKGPRVIDKVWMSKAAKLKACRQMLTVDPSCVFIAWFEATRNDFIRELNLPVRNDNVLWLMTLVLIKFKAGS